MNKKHFIKKYVQTYLAVEYKKGGVEVVINRLVKEANDIYDDPSERELMLEDFRLVEEMIDNILHF